MNECAHIIKNSNVLLAKQSLKNFLYFTRCHWWQLFTLFLNKKFLAFQSSKAPYLKL